jgi:hypothetical protein
MVAPRHTRVNEVGRPLDVGGWLFLLCRLLLVGHPVALAFSAVRALGSLPTRGLPLGLIVLCQLLVAGIGVAAGLALRDRRPGAVGLAKWSLVMSAAMDLFVYATPFMPNNRLPGSTPIFAAASLVYYTLWLEYLRRSERVRRTFPQG